MKYKIFGAIQALCLGAAVSSSANAALVDIGNGMVYDDVLDITMINDFNYAYSSGYSTNLAGKMSRAESLEWADQLTYGGYDQWRLPEPDLPAWTGGSWIG